MRERERGREVERRRVDVQAFSLGRWQKVWGAC